MDDRGDGAVPSTFTKNRDRLLAGDVAIRTSLMRSRPIARAAGTALGTKALHGRWDPIGARGFSAEELSVSGRRRDSSPPDDPGNPSRSTGHAGAAGGNCDATATAWRRPIRWAACCTGRARGRRPSWRIWATCCWTIDKVDLVDRHVCATHATGTAEREAAALLLEASAPPGSTVGADKGYDVASFVADVRIRDVTPHVAQKVRWSAIDGRTTRHAGYHISQRKRKLVEQVFGWMKTVGGLRKLRHRGIALVDWQLTFAAAAYNLVRLRNLEATCP